MTDIPFKLQPHKMWFKKKKKGGKKNDQNMPPKPKKLPKYPWSVKKKNQDAP